MSSSEASAGARPARRANARFLASALYVVSQAARVLMFVVAVVIFLWDMIVSGVPLAGAVANPSTGAVLSYVALQSIRAAFDALQQLIVFGFVWFFAGYFGEVLSRTKTPARRGK